MHAEVDRDPGAHYDHIADNCRCGGEIRSLVGCQTQQIGGDKCSSDPFAKHSEEDGSREATGDELLDRQTCSAVPLGEDPKGVGQPNCDSRSEHPREKSRLYLTGAQFSGWAAWLMPPMSVHPAIWQSQYACVRVMRLRGSSELKS